MQVLNQTVDWYRVLGVQQQAATEPSDWSLFYENRQIAIQVLGLTFTAARAAAELIDRQQPEAAPPGVDPRVSPQSLAKVQARLDAQGKSLQDKLESARRLLIKSPPSSMPQVQAQVATLQSELNLVGTKKDILASVIEVVKGAGASGAQALRAQVDAMATALPAANDASGSAAFAAALGTSSTGAGNASITSLPPAMAGTAALTTPANGLWDLGANVFRLSAKRTMVMSIDERSAELQAALAHIRAPLTDRLRALWARGDALVAQAQAETADGASLEGKNGQFEELGAQIKQIAGMLIPIGNVDNLLVQYRRNLASWRIAVKEQLRAAVKDLAIRLGVLLVVLGILLATAELSRRTVLSYVQDPQRRHQLMLMRRIVLSALVALIIAFAFVGQFGSFATFAGLITAGLALAMQSVLVSVVGYFYLIGKHGIRIGDRVQIGAVNGEVIDLGLLRMYLVEHRDDGTRAPTGRVVAFANSVVFQVTSGLFKQIPGVDFVWREITASVPAGADHARLKKDLLAAAVDVLGDARQEIERQTREIQRSTALREGGDTRPCVRLHFFPSGVEAQVRYPVHAQHAAEIDERMSQALSRIIAAAAPPAAHT